MFVQGCGLGSRSGGPLPKNPGHIQSADPQLPRWTKRPYGLRAGRQRSRFEVRSNAKG